jgi:trehalose 6-phosphate phosphatase
LLLDVDGTLAPLAPTPEAAVVPDSTLRALRRLADLGWTVVVVSGRPLAEVRRMVPVRKLVAFGSHGLEGGFDPSDLPAAIEPDVAERLETLKRTAPLLAETIPGVRVELKPAGIAFHDRLVESERLDAWHERLRGWFSLQAMDGLERLHGKRVVEVRVAGGDKGVAVRAIAARKRVTREDPSFIAIGDDVTDEDMFRAIVGLGLAVKVGDGSEPTEARLRLATPCEVGRFLVALAGEQPVEEL